MEVLIENIITYSTMLLLITGIVFYYIRKNQRQSQSSREKVNRAKELGFYEPINLHPVVNLDVCIGSAACIKACPEKDILGLIDRKATTINASRCVGHGACFHSCPVGAISLVIGTEKRGVDLPHISPTFETNIKGIYISGELAGMGLIKNAVLQGREAVEYISKDLTKADAEYDLLIIGAGPAGISATLKAKELGLKFITVEQDSLGGTVYSFPRKKIIMTSNMYLPLYGKVNKKEFTKSELLDMWNGVLKKNKISINEGEKVLSIEKGSEIFNTVTTKRTISSKTVLLAIGRRGSPRKLNIPGEGMEKVSYRLLEPELITNQHVLVVGGGDSAIEAALALTEGGNNILISYRGDSFSRLKPKNFENIKKAAEDKLINIIYKSNVVSISDKSVRIAFETDGINYEKEYPNDLVYIFAGGELPNEFLEKVGIKITKKFGEAILKH